MSGPMHKREWECGQVLGVPLYEKEIVLEIACGQGREVFCVDDIGEVDAKGGGD